MRPFLPLRWLPASRRSGERAAGVLNGWAAPGVWAPGDASRLIPSFRRERLAPRFLGAAWRGELRARNVSLKEAALAAERGLGEPRSEAACRCHGNGGSVLRHHPPALPSSFGFLYIVGGSRLPPLLAWLAPVRPPGLLDFREECVRCPEPKGIHGNSLGKLPLILVSGSD